MISPRVKRNLQSEFRRSLLAKIGLVLLVLIVLMAVFAPVLAPHNPTAQELETGQSPPIGFTQTETTTQLVDGETERVEETIEPTWDHPLGTDQFGHDMLSRLIYGVSLDE